MLELDPWQEHLCARLERLGEERGARILIHAPPQHGKSIIVSQRFPAWYLARNPASRVKLAAYNITHAARFGRIVRDLMAGDEYARMFPDPALRLPTVTSAEEWSTAARRALADAQPSFKALGLQTGFVGQGADLLIIDDPYASPQDALSEAIRASTWMFWNESARVRIRDDANVVVMFHRYHEEDLAGQLMAEGGWEELRYAAQADGDPESPDPIRRPEGQYLSPRFSEGYYDAQREQTLVWFGQFQGRPSAKTGDLFDVTKIEVVEAAPAGLARVRAWDKAATKGGGDWTAGVLMGFDGKGSYTVLDVVREQWGPGERDAGIRLVAGMDGPEVRIVGPQDPGQAGVMDAAQFVAMLAGYMAETHPVTGDKRVRAGPFAAQVNARNVKMLKGDWNGAYLKELKGFPRGRNDDQVDASADAFNALVTQANWEWS